MNQRDTLIQTMSDTLHQVKRAMHMYYTSHMDDSHSISPVQMVVLRTIYCSQPISHKALAQAMLMTPGAISQLIEGLETAGYITRTVNQTDRRSSYLSVTKPGKQALDRLNKQRQKAFTAALQGLNDSDLQTYIRVQQTLTTWLESHAN